MTRTPRTDFRRPACRRLRGHDGIGTEGFAVAGRRRRAAVDRCAASARPVPGEDRVMPTDALARARRVRLLTCDVDGVLTDGRIYVDDHGHETKAFSALDGLGIGLLLRAGIIVAWITGSTAPAVTHRARRLNVAHVVLGAADKHAPWEALRDAARFGTCRLRPHRRRPAGSGDIPRVRLCRDGAARPGRGARTRALRHGARRRRRRSAGIGRSDPRRTGASASTNPSHRLTPLRSLSDLISRMRCWAKKRWVRGARRGAYREYSQAEQQSRRVFWQQPEGTGRFGRISALLALTIFPICFRARALNCAQTASVAYAKPSPTGS